MADARKKYEGTLIRVIKDFGFIKFDDGKREIFVHSTDYRGTMAEGTRVRFEESDPDPKKSGKTHAQNVEVLPTADPHHTCPHEAPHTTARSTEKPAEKLTPPVVIKRFEVTVCQLTPDRRNPVRFVTRNAKGKPSKGEIQIITGQQFKVSGYTETFSGNVTMDTKKKGHLDLLVQLLGCDTVATFIHTQSGEVIQKSLLKEE